MRLLFFLLLVSSAFADPITVGILDQTSQGNVWVAARPTDCGSLFGHFQGTGPVICSIPGGYASASVTIGPSYPGNPFLPPYPALNATAATSYYGGGFQSLASLSISDTVIISGGTGTGYLNVDFGYYPSGNPRAVDARWSGGTQLFVPSTNPYNTFINQIWGVVTFQFGQPFSFDYSVTARDDNQDTWETTSEMSFLGAQVYTSQPTQCGPGVSSNLISGLCSDPNFTPANVLSTIYGSTISEVNAVPEPNTAWLSLVLIPLAAALRRSRLKD